VRAILFALFGMYSPLLFLPVPLLPFMRARRLMLPKTVSCPPLPASVSRSYQRAYIVLLCPACAAAVHDIAFARWARLPGAMLAAHRQYRHHQTS